MTAVKQTANLSFCMKSSSLHESRDYMYTIKIWNNVEIVLTHTNKTVAPPIK